MYESAEWAVRNELETLMTAAVAVEDVRAVTAQCMATYEQAWLGDQELSMVCSKPPSMSAALACKMPWSGARGNIDLDNDERDGGRVKNVNRARITRSLRWRRCPWRRCHHADRCSSAQLEGFVTFPTRPRTIGTYIA